MHRRKRKRPPPPGGGRGSEPPLLYLTEPAAVVANGGAPAEGGFPKGAELALAADPAPGECLSEARCNLLHRTAVSFVSYGISVFFHRSPTAAPPRAVVP